MLRNITDFLGLIMFFVAMSGVFALIFAIITGQVEDAYR